MAIEKYTTITPMHELICSRRRATSRLHSTEKRVVVLSISSLVRG